MKKTRLLLGTFSFLGICSYAQDYSGRVGINTDTPDATLQISRQDNLPEAKPQGVTFPNFSTAERSKFTGISVGTMIFNTDKKCLEMYLGVVSGVHQWACLPDVGSAKAQSVAVTAAGFEGSYVGGVPFTSANKVKFKLENNSFGNVSSSFADAVSIQNGGANITLNNCVWQKLTGGSPTGNQSSCTAGNLINLNSGESAMLWYTMNGTPETGSLQASFNKLGAQADQSTTVGLGSATITSPKTEYVVSLTYNGTDIQGKINNTDKKLVVKIPYTNGSGSYTAVNSAPVLTAAGEGNDTNNLSISIPAGNFGVNGYLDATITVDGDGEYLVTKKAPGEQYDIATIPYILNGNPYEVKIVGIGGVPDRCFGKTTLECVGYGANEKEHEFIYIPIQGPDGRTWLNNNLGAEYARVGSPYFNPTRQAGALDYNTGQELSNPTANQIKKDWRAYGSLFQWQRNPDGHELINWTQSTEGTPKYGFRNAFAQNWTNPGDNRFVLGTHTWKAWVTSYAPGTDLWRSTGVISTNPCPNGYHVPTHEEQIGLHDAIIGSHIGNRTRFGAFAWDERILRMPAAGLRHLGNNDPTYMGGTGWYWSSTLGNDTAASLWGSGNSTDYMAKTFGFFNDRSWTNEPYGHTANGMSVRCLKD